MNCSPIQDYSSISASAAAAGRMLVETSSLLLAARLADAHAETETHSAAMIATGHASLSEIALASTATHISNEPAFAIELRDFK
jgi:hypothetical protein